MRMRNMNKMKKQAGMTLIELIVVIVILGVLAALIVNSVRGSSDPANAAAIKSASQELAKAVGYTHVNLGTGLSATANPLPVTGQTMMDVLMVGRDSVATAYKTKFDSINMRPLEGDFKVTTRPSGGTPGVYEILNFPVSFVTCTAGYVCVQMQSVPSETVEALTEKYGMTFAAGTAVTTGALQYTAVSATGTHTVKMQQVP